MIKRNKKKVDEIKQILEKIVVEDEIKEEILEMIDFYNANGKIYFDNEDLYGIYYNRSDLNRANPAKEFLEIRFYDYNVFCNYSEWSNRKIVNIQQNTLKGGNTKIYKKEIENTFTYNNHNNFDIEEIEKIYNYQKRLVYDSKLKKNNDFDTFVDNNSTIVYNDNSFYNNSFSLEKNWYMENGSIIKYILNKYFVNEDDNLYEHYSICPGVFNTEFERIYNFHELDKDLFKQIMTNKITIYDLLEQVKEKTKKLK